jgi:hypothetical protein
MAHNLNQNEHNIVIPTKLFLKSTSLHPHVKETEQTIPKNGNQSAHLQPEELEEDPSHDPSHHSCFHASLPTISSLLTATTAAGSTSDNSSCIQPIFQDSFVHIFCRIFLNLSTQSKPSCFTHSFMIYNFICSFYLFFVNLISLFDINR